MLAKDPQTGERGYFTVTAVFSHTENRRVELTIGQDTISATLEHPFRVKNRGWVEAGRLHVGDCIESAEGACQMVTERRLVNEPTVVYNFTVQDAHTYFVGEGQTWVHNACPLSPTGRLCTRGRQARWAAWGKDRVPGGTGIGYPGEQGKCTGRKGENVPPRTQE